ncbi:MAG TPA: ABC transporter ATP-binding protein [Anaerolineae bacterium]|nr:ABC transporter ATP-binding protein [Anaerolineae bacterium]
MRVIEINNVSKSFYSVQALDNISLRIPQGEVVGILGPNGAGKTTLFRLIAGLLKPDKGDIRPLSGKWPAMGYKMERLLFPNRLKVSQYLSYAARLSGVPSSEIEKTVFESLTRVGLVDQAHQSINNCSKGMRQRLALAQALIGNPPFLLLDEPSNGLDPGGQVEMLQRIQDLHAEGKTILLSSHQLPEVTQVCTQLVILNRGRIQYQNSMVDALTVSPHTIITADRDLWEIAPALEDLHPDVQVDGRSVVLRNEAMELRREILARLLQEGYDVVHVERKQTTLAEVYEKAVLS